MNIADFNEYWLEYLVKNVKAIMSSGVLKEMNRINRERGTHVIKLLPLPLLYDFDRYANLASSARMIQQAQSKIARELRRRYKKKEILEFFGFNTNLADFVNWQEFLHPDSILARFDIIASKDKEYFCEFNYGSLVGGHQAFDLYKLFCLELGLNISDKLASPLDCMAHSVKAFVKKNHITTLIILIRDEFRYSGYLTERLYEEAFKQAVPDVEVILSFSTDGLRKYFGNTTAVFRLFGQGHITAELEYYQSMLKTGVKLLFGWEGELHSCKKWLSLLHDPDYQSYLNSEEITSIKRAIPHTFEIDTKNIDYALEKKDNYIFKKNISSGGKGIAIGRDHSKDELLSLISEQTGGTWSAQEMIETVEVDMPVAGRPGKQQHTIALGLFFNGDCTSGLDVRASSISKVVNVTGGAMMSWAYPTEVCEKERMISSEFPYSPIQEKA